MKLIENIDVAVGSTILIGNPAVDSLREFDLPLTNMVDAIKEVSEAYTPQVFITEKMIEPSQILLIVSNEAPTTVFEKVSSKLLKTEIKDLYIWVIGKDSEFYGDVLMTDTLIYRRTGFFGKILKLFLAKK